MDWESPKILLLAIPLLALLLWIESKSAHPMEGVRKRLLLVVRAVGVLLALLALAGPARVQQSGKKAMVVILDHSQSMGGEGLTKVFARARDLRTNLPPEVECFFVALGDEAALLPEEGPRQTASNGREFMGGRQICSAGLSLPGLCSRPARAGTSYSSATDTKRVAA